MASDQQWTIEHPDRIQLYSLPTPNGQKASIALEELGLPYEAHRVNIMEGDQFSDAFRAVNPNSKIPAVVDPKGPDGQSHRVFESGAILLYLAEKTGQLLPSTPVERSECLQWLFFQMGGVGPMSGQLGHFHRFAKERIEYGVERYRTETLRLLGILEERLRDREFLAGDAYSIADIAAMPCVVCLDVFYEMRGQLRLDADFPAVMTWVERSLARPATARGMKIPT